MRSLPKIEETVRLKAMRAVFVTREDGPALYFRRRYAKPESVFEAFRYLTEEVKEHFVVLHLDVKNRAICYDPVSTGSLSASVVHPREVFKSALLSSAAALILVHNHPSGDPTPSVEDRKLTAKLQEGCDLLGLQLLDHVIVGEEGYFSFAQSGQVGQGRNQQLADGLAAESELAC